MTPKEVVERFVRANEFPVSHEAQEIVRAAVAELAQEVERLKTENKEIYQRNILVRNAHTKADSEARNLRRRVEELEQRLQWAKDNLSEEPT